MINGKKFKVIKTQKPMVKIIILISWKMLRILRNYETHLAIFIV